MKRYLLIFFLFIIAIPVFSQENNRSAANSSENTNINVTIFPVPVRDNSFTINSDKDITYVKITNIIGQDIFTSRFYEQKSIRISLNNAKRGIYIITISFSDNTRIVRKIMVEE
jgi:hypothetical protein